MAVKGGTMNVVKEEKKGKGGKRGTLYTAREPRLWKQTTRVQNKSSVATTTTGLVSILVPSQFTPHFIDCPASFQTCISVRVIFSTALEVYNTVLYAVYSVGGR